MHVPDGFIDAPVSMAAGVVAAGGLAVCLRGARRELDDRTAPMAGLVAAFIFAVQMLNFPVAAGTSGHLLGGALAAALVGPYTGALCVAVVIGVQALLFADGGLTALGINIDNMALVTVVVGYAVFRLLVRVLPYSRAAVSGSAFVAALVSVPVASLSFVALYALGGTADVPVAKVATAMVGVHVLIGLGEGLITALTVGAVVAVRPDLVRGVRDRIPAPQLRPTGVVGAGGAGRPLVGSGAAAGAEGRVSARTLLLAGAALAVVLAGGVSYYASNSPDGLNKVAADTGFAQQETQHHFGTSPLAGYGTTGVADERASVGLAGVAGVLVTFAVVGALVLAVRRRRRRHGTTGGHPHGSHAGGHSQALYRPGTTVVHRLPPQCKIAAVLVFVVVVVATPKEQFWAFAVYALLLAAVARLAQVPAAVVLRRMVVEVPFVLFALLLPFIASGDTVHVLGLELSESGLLGAWNILAKGTLGVVASILLAATTEPRALLLGVERLHLPPLMVQIMTFMLRYADVIGGEMHRMRIARESRGFQARNVRELGVVAQSAGALFIRSYERGERVHLAMLSRGYAGSMPTVDDVRAGSTAWSTAAALPAAALVVAVLAWGMAAWGVAA